MLLYHQYKRVRQYVPMYLCIYVPVYLCTPQRVIYTSIPSMPPKCLQNTGPALNTAMSGPFSLGRRHREGYGAAAPGRLNRNSVVLMGYFAREPQAPNKNGCLPLSHIGVGSF